MKEILFRKTVEGIPNDDSEHSTYDSNSGDHLNLETRYIDLFLNQTY